MALERIGSTVALTVLLAGCAGGAVRSAALPAQCTAREVARDSLRLVDGSFVYVEPSAFVADERGQILIAGSRNMVMTVDGDRVTGAFRDTLLGIVVPTDGAAAAIDPPVDGPIGGVRAIAEPGGGWTILFAEMSGSDRERDSRVLGLWAGKHDGTRWTHLEPLPLPGPGEFRHLFVPSPVVRGDTLVWAGTYVDSLDTSIALYTRTGGRWSLGLIPTYHSEVHPAFDPDSGLVLLVVQADRTLGSDGNSLLLWTRSPEWRSAKRLVTGSIDGRVYVPGFHLGGEVRAVSWPTVVRRMGSEPRQELRALLGSWDESDAVVVDSSVPTTQYPIAPHPVGGNRLLWVTEHQESNEREIRLVTVGGSSVEVVGRTPSPFWIPWFNRSLGLGPHTILVTGQHRTPDYKVVSLLIRFSVECSP